MHDWNEIFGPDGPLAASVCGFSVRPEQIGMARRVAQALRTGAHLIVEAGTGIGKTYAYLVPALLSGRGVSSVAASAANGSGRSGSSALASGLRAIASSTGMSSTRVAR